MHKRIALLLVTGLFSTIGLVACGSDENSGSSAGTPQDYNASDIEFAQSMMPHHLQAIELSTLASTRSNSPQVKKLAEQIQAAQKPEMDTMQAWLAEWAPPGDHSDDTGAMNGMDGMSDMPGMMSMENINGLAAASGKAFDRMFLTMMIEHHQGAITMAETEIDDGQHPDAIALAEDIVRTQQAEITQMQGMLDELD